MTKRSLKLMPEVLPVPTRSIASSSARERTLGHMRRLVATAAVLPLADCTKEDSQTVTIPASSTTATAPEHVAINTTATATSTVTAKPTATAPDMGYAVVDPMPAPAMCMGLAPASKVAATLHRDAANGIVLEVTVTLAQTGNWSGASFNTVAAPSAWAATVVSSQFRGGTATIKLKPSAPQAGSSTPQTTIGASFAITCTAGPGHLSVNATLTLPFKDGDKPVALTLNDY